MTADTGHAQAEIDRLRARLAELEGDAARLDWLEDHDAQLLRVARSQGKSAAWQVRYAHAGSRVRSEMTPERRYLRDAIDAGRRATGEGGGE